MKLSQAPNRDVLLDRIKESSREFQRLLEGSELRALNYLLFTNSGGAVATAGFIGTTKSSDLPLGPIIALALFLVGVVVAGILAAYSVHVSRRLVIGGVGYKCANVLPR